MSCCEKWHIYSRSALSDPRKYGIHFVFYRICISYVQILDKTYNTISTRVPVYLHGLTHWGRVTHICVSKLTIIGSDNGLSPSRRQAIIWTYAGILLIRPSGTNFSETLIEIDVFTFKKMHLKMSSSKCRPFCLGLNVLSKIMAWIINCATALCWN